MRKEHVAGLICLAFGLGAGSALFAGTKVIEMPTQPAPEIPDVFGDKISLAGFTLGMPAKAAMEILEAEEERGIVRNYSASRRAKSGDFILDTQDFPNDSRYKQQNEIEGVRVDTTTELIYTSPIGGSFVYDIRYEISYDQDGDLAEVPSIAPLFTETEDKLLAKFGPPGKTESFDVPGNKRLSNAKAMIYAWVLDQTAAQVQTEACYKFEGVSPEFPRFDKADPASGDSRGPYELRRDEGCYLTITAYIVHENGQTRSFMVKEALTGLAYDILQREDAFMQSHLDELTAGMPKLGENNRIELPDL